MPLIKAGTIIFMIAVDWAIWAIIRIYERRGIIIGFPRNTHRDQAPTWFRVQIVGLWLAFALSVALTLLFTLTILLANEHAPD